MGQVKNHLIQITNDDTINMDFEMQYHEIQHLMDEIRQEQKARRHLFNWLETLVNFFNRKAQ